MGGDDRRGQVSDVGDDDGALEPTERFSVSAGEVRPLDASTIHSVQAAAGRYLGAVHVYGGDLFGTPRSTWRDGVEQPTDESALPAFFRWLRAREDALGRAMTVEEVTELLSSPAPDGR
jgi:hypothetical protein